MGHKNIPEQLSFETITFKMACNKINKKMFFCLTKSNINSLI